MSAAMLDALRAAVAKTLSRWCTVPPSAITASGSVDSRSSSARWPSPAPLRALRPLAVARSHRSHPLEPGAGPAPPRWESCARAESGASSAPERRIARPRCSQRRPAGLQRLWDGHVEVLLDEPEPLVVHV